MRRSLLPGIMAALLAAAAWSLSFIVPFVIGGYSLFDFALIEFLVSGLVGIGVLWRHAGAVRLLSVNDWLAAFWLGLIGYLAYFLAVMGAALYAGPVITPAFIGLVPVVLGIAGNVRERSVPWKALVLPLTLAAAGLLLVNGGALLSGAVSGVPGRMGASLPAGVALAIAAVTLWTCFGLMNQGALVRRPVMDSGVWTALILVGAALATLILLPIGLLAGVFEIPRLGLHWEIAAPLMAWATGLAIVANVGGALAWTFASRRLTVVLSAQLITMEPTFGTVFGLLVHHRWPSLAETAGMLMLLTGVVVAIGLFAGRARYNGGDDDSHANDGAHEKIERLPQRHSDR